MSKGIRNMWPLKLDMSKDECRGVLRRLELEAYSSVISTFRAQGSLDSGKQNVLDQLRRCFHISEDRHKAEARRVANSEKLTTISELLTGKSFDLEWIREGHRSYPLIGRAPPYSALHILADHASKAATIENSDLPVPSETKRLKILDEDSTVKQIVTEDPTLPPPSPSIFGISRKDLKKNLDFVSLHQSSRKKHYQHLKPPPPPNVKIQHLYQTLNAKRPRKSLTKKSPKPRVSKQSPGRMHLPYPPHEEKHHHQHFDGAELQRHLTSQLMPPPMSPMKSPFAPILPANVGKKDVNLIKMNHQPIEPQAHYIPNNPSRLKGESRSQRKISGLQSKHSYQSRNGAGSRNMDHIPDPQIIFNTTSSMKMEQAMDVKPIEHHNHDHNNHDIDMSQQAMASPLQLLSTAASCTPKLKITSSPTNSQSQQHQPSTSSQALLLPAQSAIKTVQNRAIKIIPTNTKQMITKPNDAVKQQQQHIAAQPSKFKIQKIQLVMNKNQDGPPNLSPSATIVSGKAGQLLLSGKGITNSYQVGGKSPYTIVSAPKSAAGGPKVIVQTIDRNFALKDSTESMIPENQRITENTPIDFMPSSYPKVILKSHAPKQIKLKLGASLINSKIIKGSIPTNLKIQRQINTKGFTVLNSSQIVQLQAQQAAQAMSSPTTSSEGSKVDWEQELDDVNRKGGKSASKSNGSGSAPKKPRVEETDAEAGEIVQEEIADRENVIVENVVDVFEIPAETKTTVEQSQTNIPDLVSEYVFLSNEDGKDISFKPTSDEPVTISIENGEESLENGQVEQSKRPQQNHSGAEAYENLVKSLTECENDYMKEITEDAQIDENFGLIDGNILDQYRESGLFQ